MLGVARAQDGPTVGEPVEETVGPPVPPSQPLLDRTQQGVYSAVWRSAMRIDSMFGAAAEPMAYAQASGSLAPALLWDEFDGFKPRFRFRVDLPLPQLNERFDAFIGRVNPDEFVTERAQPSGAFRRQYGPLEDDQTIFGIRYRDRAKPGGQFDLGAGVRVRFPMDPYIKGSYVYEYGSPQALLLSTRQTAFWQNSEDLGFTSRVDLSRIIEERWLFRWTGSGTFSQQSEGLRGYTTLTAMRGFPPRRALAVELGLNGETDADVPMREFGMKVAYRQSVLRDWLVLETRASLTWPKELPEQPRAPSWGVGIGLEMFFGTDQFLARPVTF